MSMMFRAIAAITRTPNAAMTIAGVLITVYILYMGFVIPVPLMRPWFSWIRWLNPVFYVYEALIVNEFHGRQFACSQFVPPYQNLTGDTFVCSISGAFAGQTTVSGDEYISAQYNSSYKHIWRNLGILIGFLLSFLGTYLAATELNILPLTTPNIRIFRRGHIPAYSENFEDGTNHWLVTLQRDKRVHREYQIRRDGHLSYATGDFLTWQNICYNTSLNASGHQLLDGISGWARAGTLTALMGVTGAGKSTLLKILTQEVSVGIVSGDIRIGGQPMSESVRRDVGYVQQQDVLLPTSTVREALRFSASLRQPSSVPMEEKFKYVEEIIHMLQMDDFAEAVVGLPGAGLSEQERKLLSLGVELAAKPAFLLALDGPTTALDPQASLSFYALLRRVADSGLAVLSTVHQPSAAEFELFDHLLLLAQGGRTIYFGENGNRSSVVLGYFARNGAPKCALTENVSQTQSTHVMSTGQTDY